MPLTRRVPKRGFTNIFKKRWEVVNLDRLAELDVEGEITPEVLRQLGVVRPGIPVKVLGNGETKKKLRVSAHKFSRSARSKIEKAGGSCEVIDS